MPCIKKLNKMNKVFFPPKNSCSSLGSFNTTESSSGASCRKWPFFSALSWHFTRFGMIPCNNFIFLTRKKKWGYCTGRICSESCKNSVAWHLLPIASFWFSRAALQYFFSPNTCPTPFLKQFILVAHFTAFGSLWHMFLCQNGPTLVYLEKLLDIFGKTQLF